MIPVPCVPEEDAVPTGAMVRVRFIPTFLHIDKTPWYLEAKTENHEQKNRVDGRTWFYGVISRPASQSSGC